MRTKDEPVERGVRLGNDKGCSEAARVVWGNGAKRGVASRTRKGTEGTARCLSVYAPQGAPTRSGRRDERSENRRSVVRRHRAGSASGRRPGVRGSRRRGVGHDVSGEGRVGRGK